LKSKKRDSVTSKFMNSREREITKNHRGFLGKHFVMNGQSLKTKFLFHS